MTVAFGWAQTTDGTPMVVFLEPSDGATIPSDVDSIQIRFRLISPDNTNLMRYQPFVNGLPGNEPIPIDPPSPQVELTILWRGVKQFPDGAHIISIKVVDAKGREGMGSLTLYKGRDSTKPTAEILHPKSGDTLRGQVPILVRVSDDRGVRGITVSATQRETSKTQTIYMAVGNYGRFMEVRVIWDTTMKHPETKEDLFPDGIYLLQARVRDQEGNEGVSNEVLVIVQNKVAQPLISQVAPGQTARGGATPPVSLTETPQTTQPSLPLTVPTGEGKPSPIEGSKVTPTQAPAQVAIAAPAPQPRPAVAVPTPESVGQRVAVEPGLPKPEISLPQVAMATITPQPRLTIALPTPEGAGQKVVTEPSLQRTDLPSPQVAGAVPTSSRPSLSVGYGESKVAASYAAPQPQLQVAATPQVASVERRPVNVPAGQIQLASAWLPPAPRTLQKSPELSEMPKVAAPTLVPRLPAPETRPVVKKPLRQTVVEPAHSFRYTVIAGDTLYSLAERFGISVKELAAANGLPENAPLRIGQRLIIPARPVTVLVDGKPAECEVPAFVRNGISVGSFRAVVEASGGIVGWDNERKRATATLGTLNLIAIIGKSTLEVNGEQVPLSIAPFLLRNRTFLPLRELGTALGKEVRWEKGTLLMETPKR
ncbi:MAG: stalk domain-containing protein [Armatimonadota bacterium]|nr:stalk domain-containing protein [Armatimonadota bacterium]